MFKKKLLLLLLCGYGKYSKYNLLTKSQLKKILKELKSTSNTLTEIRYVAKLLRSKMRNQDSHQFRDHQAEIDSNFWSYCKAMFESRDKILPEFSKETCFMHFKNVLFEKAKSTRFSLPSWLKPMMSPTVALDLSAPTYKEVTSTIRKIKSSGSPCPLDHISIIPMKHCPALRTYLWKILVHCWELKVFPDAWKNGITVLAHKRGPASDPENFRPITLEPVLSKIYTSIIRNRIYKFLKDNNYIENTYQKGFWTDISGTIEHTETMSCMIDNARMKQRNLVVTLLDLRNAFGEVHHSLLTTILRYHHIPTEICGLVSSLYRDYQVSIATSTFVTDPISVQRGVLQGDSLSPLLFNLVVNSLINAIKVDKIRCLGYTSSCALITRHWFQFADDTAITTAYETDNQLLCNVFSEWSTWADLNIRIDKCHTFGIKKSGSRAIQYQPNIKISNQRVPAVADGESFTYLGKQFNFAMNCDSVKAELISDVTQYLAKIDLMPIKPLQKIKIVQQYVYSKLRWRFSIYNLTSTWVKQNLENLVAKSIRKWLQIPISGNITHLSFPVGKLGLNFRCATDLYHECQLSVRRILKTSSNTEQHRIYSLTSRKNYKVDQIVDRVTSTITDKSLVKAETKKIFFEKTIEEKAEAFGRLKEQSAIISHVQKVCTSKSLQNWQIVVSKLPSNIACFCRRALIFSLANASNLKRWGQSDGKCALCGDLQTQLHVFSFCKCALERFLWRHNSVLHTVVHHLRQIKNIKLYADLPGSGLPHPSEIFSSLVPDLIIALPEKITVVELTVPFETNSNKARSYKTNRYINLRSQLLIPCEDFEVIPV